MRRFLAWSFPGLLASFGMFTILQPGALEFSVTPRGGGAPYLVAPMRVGERFTLHYQHSVDHGPIWEEHSVDADGNIFLEEERCLMFGAGMGHWPGHGELTGRGAHQVIRDIHAPIRRFLLRIGSPGVDHTLIWRGERVNLSAHAPGELVEIDVHRVNRLQRIWRHLVGSSADDMVWES